MYHGELDGLSVQAHSAPGSRTDQKNKQDKESICLESKLLIVNSLVAGLAVCGLVFSRPARGLGLFLARTGWMGAREARLKSFPPESSLLKHARNAES